METKEVETRLLSVTSPETDETGQSGERKWRESGVKILLKQGEYWRTRQLETNSVWEING